MIQFQIFFYKGLILALKQDLKEVKSELGAQEKFLQSLIQSERFLRKNQKIIILLLIVVIIAFVGNYFSGVIKSKEIAKENSYYLQVLKDPKDQKALDYLKDNNINLYALALLKEAKDGKINNNELSNLASNNNLNPLLKDLINYQLGKNSAPLMSEYSTLIDAYKDLEKNNIVNGFNELSKIPLTSPLKPFVDQFKHYHGNKK